MLTALAVPSMAATRASNQIDDYTTSAEASGSGKIKINFSVSGTRKMSEIGGKDIAVYEKWGSSWMLAGSFRKSDPGMSTTNSSYFDNTVYFNGASGTEYKIVVTVFATDSSGTDSRTQTHYVTAT